MYIINFNQISLGAKENVIVIIPILFAICSALVKNTHSPKTQIDL